MLLVLKLNLRQIFAYNLLAPVRDYFWLLLLCICKLPTPYQAPLSRKWIYAVVQRREYLYSQYCVLHIQRYELLNRCREKRLILKTSQIPRTSSQHSTPGENASCGCFISWATKKCLIYAAQNRYIILKPFQLFIYLYECFGLRQNFSPSNNYYRVIFKRYQVTCSVCKSLQSWW